MEDIDQIQVVVTVDRDARPIQGRMRVGGGDAVRFYGWLELNDRFEQAFTSDPTPRTEARQ